MVKAVGVLGILVVGLSWGLYAQIGKAAEVGAALRIFQAELAAQVEENQRVQALLIQREKENQAIRVASQQKRTQAHETIARKPAEDCVNAPVPDDLRLLIN
jgi:hypothetical protein